MRKKTRIFKNISEATLTFGDSSKRSAHAEHVAKSYGKKVNELGPRGYFHLQRPKHAAVNTCVQIFRKLPVPEVEEIRIRLEQMGDRKSSNIAEVVEASCLFPANSATNLHSASEAEAVTKSDERGEGLRALREYHEAQDTALHAMYFSEISAIKEQYEFQNAEMRTKIEECKRLHNREVAKCNQKIDDLNRDLEVARSHLQGARVIAQREAEMARSGRIFGDVFWKAPCWFRDLPLTLTMMGTGVSLSEMKDRYVADSKRAKRTRS